MENKTLGASMLRSIFYLLVILSGFTGVAYQVTWQRYLNMFMGAHSFSVALILSVFFLFLSLGYLVIGQHFKSWKLNPLWLYGILEGVIGIYALVSPMYFHFLYDIWPRFAVGSFLDVFSGVGFTIFFIALPTFLMGGTIPVLVEGFSKKESEAASIHSKVYGLNTLGAFLGAMATGFYFIEAWGLPISLMNLGLINIFLFLVVFFMKKSLKHQSYEEDLNYTKDSNQKMKYSLSICGISFLFGYITFSIEGLSIRLAGILLGSTHYTYTLIVSVFILSIAIGSWYANRLKDKNLDRHILLQQTAIGISLILFYVFIPEMSYWAYRIKIMIFPTAYNFYVYQAIQFFFLFGVLFVPVSLLGMNIPMLFAKLKTEVSDIGPLVGKLYFWNSLGSFLGALGGGYILLMYFDDRVSFKFSIVLVFVSLAIYLLNFSKKRAWALVPLAVAILSTQVRDWKDSELIPGAFLIQHAGVGTSPREAFDQSKKDLKFYFSELDPNTMVHVIGTSKSKNRGVYVNAKPDAVTGGDSKVRAYNALMPLLLSKEKKSVFVIGAGAGLSMSIFSDHPDTEKIKVAEISKGVIKALKYFDDFNNSMVSRGLPKIDLINDDAYKVLKQENDQYDIIVCEPSNPWINGVESLYTEEFLSAGKEKLKDKGLYAQWFPFSSVSPEVFLSVVKNFASIYKWVGVFSEGGGAFLILASDEAPQVDSETLNANFEKLKPNFKKLGFQNATQALMSQLFTDSVLREMSASGAVHSMEFPSVGTLSAKNAFSNKFMEMKELLEKKLFKRFAEEDLDFLYKKVPGGLTKENYEFALQKFKSETIKFHLDRFRFEYAQQFKDLKKVKISPDSFKKWEYIVGADKKVQPRLQFEKRELDLVRPQWAKLPGSEKKKMSFELFVKNQDRTKFLRLMNTVYESQMEVDDKNASQYFPKTCDSETCYYQKLEFLRISRKAKEEMYSITGGDLKSKPGLSGEIESYFNSLYF